MVGPTVKNPVHPAPVKLYGTDLPWVTHATHLGHELNQDCTMNMDTRMKRAAFIKNSVDTRTMFSFALPTQVLNAIMVYSAHFYGSPIWDLYGEIANQVYKRWNTSVKLVWDLPRATHNFFVDNFLAESFSSVRKNILVQYTSFVKRLGKSVSDEVRIMSRIAGSDIRSTMGKNCHNLKEEFKLDPWKDSTMLFKEAYKYYEIPEVDRWRIPLLRSLLREKYEMYVCGEETEVISGLIESLCYS